MKDQTIEVPLKVGSRLTIFEDIDMDDEYGFVGTPAYEATVEQYVPETNLLVMSDGSGMAEVQEHLENADSVQVIYDES